MAEQSPMSRRVGNPNTDVYINGRQNNITFPFGLNVYNDPGFANPNTFRRACRTAAIHEQDGLYERGL
jgi:hypothetical protein